MCQKLLPTSFIRPHNHQDELSTPWATLLKTFAGYTGMEKELQAMHTQDPCRAGNVQAVLSKQNPLGGLAAALPPLLTRLCLKQAPASLPAQCWLALTPQSLASLHTAMHRFHLRQGICSQEGVLWAHLPGLCDCTKSCTFFCFSFQHKHMESGKLFHKELYFLPFH